MSDDALEIWIDPGEASAEDIAEVLIALSELHRAYGGSGLTFTPAEPPPLASETP